MSDQLNAGVSALNGNSLWHTNMAGEYWCGHTHDRTPQQLLDECKTTIEDLLKNHPELDSDKPVAWVVRGQKEFTFNEQMACVGWPRMGVAVDPVFTRPQFQPRNVDIQQAVNRFLGWRLPKDFSPDAGISFKPDANPDSPVELQYTNRPTGTNLFNADQAKAMFEYALHASFK